MGNKLQFPLDTKMPLLYSVGVWKRYPTQPYPGYRCVFYRPELETLFFRVRGRSLNTITGLPLFSLPGDDAFPLILRRFVTRIRAHFPPGLHEPRESRRGLKGCHAFPPGTRPYAGRSKKKRSVLCQDVRLSKR